MFLALQRQLVESYFMFYKKISDKNATQLRINIYSTRSQTWLWNVLLESSELFYELFGVLDATGLDVRVTRI